MLQDLKLRYYYTALSLSWYAWLYHSSLESKKVGKSFEIELITDVDMKYLFVEQSMRGGLSQISKRYANSNNKFI
jgi:hypothetical protein